MRRREPSKQYRETKAAARLLSRRQKFVRVMTVVRFPGWDSKQTNMALVRSPALRAGEHRHARVVFHPEAFELVPPLRHNSRQRRIHVLGVGGHRVLRRND